MPELRRMRPLLGTHVEVAARGAHAQAGLEAAFQAIAAAHERWSFQRADSELSRLNARPGEWVGVSDATVRLLWLARGMTLASAGRFDCTVGGTLVLLGHLPDHGGPAPLTRGAAADIELRRGAARLRRPVRLTLDGIAKGYAVDLAVQAMRRSGVTSGHINAGGDVCAFGEAQVPMHRRELDGRLAPLGVLRAAALATSRSGATTADFPSCLVGAVSGTPELHSVMALRAWRADALTKVAAATLAVDRAQAVARLGGHWVVPSAAMERLAA